VPRLTNNPYAFLPLIKVALLVTGVTVQQVMRGTVPFPVRLLIPLLLITLVTAFSLWLPGFPTK